MPVFYQKDINADTRLGIWKIAEEEQFFLQQVPFPEGVKHPYKRLQHLAGRYLLQYLFPDFPYHEIAIASTRKPYLPHEQFHFSISHSGNYAAAIVSKTKRAGIDIELYSPKTALVQYKFLTDTERILLQHSPLRASVHSQLSVNNYQPFTLAWCCKEAVYKYWGMGGVDFKKHICMQHINTATQQVAVLFAKQHKELSIQYSFFDELCLAWTISE